MIGAPCSGKSTVAAGLYHQMKVLGYSVELVTEFAKDVVWDGHFRLLEDQVYVFAQQNRRLDRLVGKVAYVITDSPLILSAFYAPRDYPQSFETFAIDFYRHYDNQLFYLERAHRYSSQGRLHMEAEADEIAKRMLDYLRRHDLSFERILSDANAVPEILGRVTAEDPPGMEQAALR